MSQAQLVREYDEVVTFVAKWPSREEILNFCLSDGKAVLTGRPSYGMRCGDILDV